MATPSDGSDDSVTQRPALLSISVTLLLFFGAGFFGVWLADRMAPDSALAPMLGLLTLPLAFILGMNAWLGLALFTAIWVLLRRLLQSHALRRAAYVASVPPGAFVFVPVATVISGLAGAVMALLATESGAWTTWSIYLLCGVVYGILCWIAARSGYLPFPAE